MGVLMDTARRDLGCCGYDELAEKPPTTRPLKFQAARFVRSGKQDIRNMIGYAPFLGQVRLVRRPLLGQTSLTTDQVASYVDQIDRLFSRYHAALASRRGRTLPSWETWENQASVAYPIVQAAWSRLTGGSEEDYYWTEEENAATLKFSRAVLELESLLEKAEISQSPVQPMAPSSIPSAPKGKPDVQKTTIQPTAQAAMQPPQKGLPTWAYIVGGLAVAGLVAYVATG